MPNIASSSTRTASSVSSTLSTMTELGNLGGDLTSLGLSHDLTSYMKNNSNSLDDPTLQMCSFLF